MKGSALSGQFVTERISRVIFGVGTLGRLPAELDALGAKRVLVVTGRSIATRTPLLDQVLVQLGGRCAAVFDGARQHVPESTVLEATALAREVGADLLVSLGGGSPVDTAKAVAMVLAEGEDLRALRVEFEYPDRLRVPVLDKPKLPHIAITTTLSAAEFSDITGCTEETTQAKHLYVHPTLCPRVVILDPELTVYTPEELFLATGVKALDHNVERLYSRQAQPISDALALESARMLCTCLPRVKADPSDLEARCQLQVAAYMSIYCSANVRVGLGHALGHQVGARCNVPHGIAGAIILPRVMAFNLPTAAHKLARLAAALEVAQDGMGDREAAAAAITAVEDLVVRLGLPRRLRDVGVERALLPEIARAAVRDLVAATNPRPIGDVMEVLSLLEEAW